MTTTTQQTTTTSMLGVLKVTNSIFFKHAGSSSSTSNFLEIDSNNLKENSITHVLSLVSMKPETTSTTSTSSNSEKQQIVHNILSYGSIVGSETTTETVSDFFEGCLNFLVEAFKCKKDDKPFGILIRTDYETDYSPCVVALAFYLIEEKKLTVDNSLTFIHPKLRPENPEESIHDWLSPIFVEQLKFYINERKETISEYYCQICRLKLFSTSDLIEHAPTEKRGLKDFEYKKLRKDAKRGVSKTAKNCTSLYLRERMDWMVTNEEGDCGRIFCKCNHRVGSFKWSGSQCSCGIWVSPSIQIQMSRVDEK